MQNASRADEQRRVDHVIDRLHHRLGVVADQIDQAHAETRDVEQNYGDNTKVNITEVDDRMETNAAVQQQKQLVARAVENEQILQKEQARLTRLAHSPYFGRIDITEDGADDTLYIGTGTFQDSDNQFLVYDWRAPVASIYYNGTLGPVDYNTPVGTAHATLNNKRQFQIEHGEIRNMFDTSETVGDSILQEVLGDASSEYMQNIVATIQQEQNTIIRDTSSDLLLVQGAAGSGKTSAVLQRIAFQLYHSRSTLDANQMVLFSPNKLYATYISQVLPSLGEKNMIQTTLVEFLARRLTGLQVETLFDRFERDESSFPEAAKAMRRVKESAAFMDAARVYAKHDAEPHFVDVDLNGETFFAAANIQKIYDRLPRQMTLADKFAATRKRLMKRLNTRIGLETHQDWVDDILASLNEEQVQHYIGNQRFENGADELRAVARAVVAERFAPVYTALYDDYFFDPYLNYLDFLRQYPQTVVDAATWSAMCDAVGLDLESHRLRLDDAAPLMMIRDVLTGGGQNHAIQSVFVDEMQDYSIATLKYLHHAFPRAQLTFLGDVAQDVFTGDYTDGQNYLADLQRDFADLHPRLVTLDKSYRSTRPITDFANALIPAGKDITAFSRTGVLPQLITVPQRTYQPVLSTLVNHLLQRHPTVAILTKDAATARKVALGLQTDVDVTLLSKDDHQLSRGCVVLPVYLAKGLEFDAVIGFDVSATSYTTPGDRDILYTLCTRTLHELVLVARDAPSPLLKDVPATLYTRLTGDEYLHHAAEEPANAEPQP